jgi:hypothetical protein
VRSETRMLAECLASLGLLVRLGAPEEVIESLRALAGKHRAKLSREEVVAAERAAACMGRAREAPTTYALAQLDTCDECIHLSEEHRLPRSDYREWCAKQRLEELDALIASGESCPHFARRN